MSTVRKLFSVNDLFILSSFLILLSGGAKESFPFLVISLAFFLLANAILTAVHNSENIALKIGPSLGTIVLALSVTVIEVAFIINMMKHSPQAAATIARDAVFAAVMIVANGTIGISILLGGMKHRELSFQKVGTSSLMGSLAILTVLTMILPNYTTSTGGGTYNISQLIFVSLASLFIYFSLVWAQTSSHKTYFSDDIVSDSATAADEATGGATPPPSNQEAWMSFVRLVLSLVAVIGLAKLLSPTFEAALDYINAPPSTVGIVIALLVLAPETLAALNSAKSKQLQTTLNLALGSAAASIALTIPTVTVYSLVTVSPLVLGLDPKNICFLLLTFIVSAFTFGTGRATSLHGLMHLMILFSYLILSFIP